MYVKLVLRNLRRSLKDYMIYFLTMTLAVGLIFSFNSLGVSKAILELAENMSSLKPTMNFISVIVVLMMAYLVNYITKFIVKRRKKEFGLYILLGMENEAVAKMFIYENIVFGFFSFILGLVIGFLFFQGLIYIIMKIFDNPYSFQMKISFKAILITFIYYSIIYLITILTSSRLVSKMNIYDLLYSSRKNEEINYRKGNMLKFIFSLILCFVGIKLLLYAFNINDNRVYYYVFGGLICIGVGVYSTYVSISYFIVFITKRIRKFRYKNTNTFLIRQITSKLNTNGKTMGVIAILMTVSLILLISGLAFGGAYKVNIKSEAPFDVSVAIDYPHVQFNEVYSFINEKVTIKQYVDYKLYKNNTDTEKKFGNDYMKLSVYNELREQIGLAPVFLPKDKFIIHCESWYLQDEVEKRLENAMVIMIDSKTLSSGRDYLFKEAFAQYGTNGDNYLYVVNDDLFEKLQPTKSRFIASTIKPANQSLRNQLNSFLRENYYVLLIKDFKHNENQHITKKIVIKSWSYANGLVGLSLFSFGSLYISVVFIMIGMTILALQQLTDSTEHKDRFNILRKIGVSNNDINNIIFKQIFIYFALPTILPIIITLLNFWVLNKKLGHIIMEKNLIINTTITTFYIFFAVYILYFIITYIGFKRNISIQTK